MQLRLRHWVQLDSTGLVLADLRGDALAYGTAKPVRIHRCAGSAAAHKRNVLVVARATSCKLARDARAVREEARGLEHRSHLTTDPADPCDHPKLAHVGSYKSDIIAPDKLVDAVERPTRGKPRVLVEEVAALLTLMFVHTGAEPDVSLGPLNSELELLHPKLVVPVHVFIEFLKLGKHCTRRRPDHQHRLVLDDRVPAALPVGSDVKVVTVHNVHRCTRGQAVLFAYRGNAFGAEHLAHVCAGQLLVEPLHLVPLDRQPDPLVRVNLVERVAEDRLVQDNLVLALRHDLVQLHAARNLLLDLGVVEDDLLGVRFVGMDVLLSLDGGLARRREHTSVAARSWRIDKLVFLMVTRHRCVNLKVDCAWVLLS